MGTLTAEALFDKAAEIAQDASHTLMTESQALEWVNDAQRAIVTVRPDANAETKAYKLPNKGETKQTIDGLRLMAVHRNMGSGGSTPGRPIRLVARGVKDEYEPNWHAATPATTIKEYIYDERSPDVFWVSPPAHGSTDVYVELTQSLSPADVAAKGDPITLDDIYGPVIIEWVLYRFFSRDSEETPNWQRAARHYDAFFRLLGVKTESDIGIAPNPREHLQ